SVRVAGLAPLLSQCTHWQCTHQSHQQDCSGLLKPYPMCNRLWSCFARANVLVQHSCLDALQETIS
uniref:Uncharacterized protein n=1 Tax=Aegilops tauschii subsp. strangulata TaxID=200361 RepID=A0A453L4E2_AEGTS